MFTQHKATAKKLGNEFSSDKNLHTVDTTKVLYCYGIIIVEKPDPHHCGGSGAATRGNSTRCCSRSKASDIKSFQAIF
jgi:hypothetical protein